jgi:mono/diheme cytochrome c family protein
VKARIAITAAAAAFLFSIGGVRAADDPVLAPPALAKADGETIYRHVCQGCHMPDGRGAEGAGHYPALADDAQLESARYVAAVVFNGRRNMPHFGAQPELSGPESLVVMHLDDAQIARVVNYVRSHFGNHYTDELTAEDIASMRP